MALIKGISVVLFERVDTGQQDDFGNPIFDYIKTVVDNVLVAPASASEIVDQTQLEGKKEVYTLAIPKNDIHEWKNSKVEFFGKTFRQFGGIQEGIEDMIPLKWNKKVMVEYYE